MRGGEQAGKGSRMFGLFQKQPAKPTPPVVREFFRAANVYCRSDADQAIVVSVYNHGGLMAEKPGGASIVKLSDPAALHEAVRAALDACEYAEDFNYSQTKPSDWPAYQASGYKTVKKFEAEFIRLPVKGVNEKNFFYDVTTPDFGEFGLHLTMTVDAYSGNFGEAIPYLVKNYLACSVVAGS
jgi:hypothetical protein